MKTSVLSPSIAGLCFTGILSVLAIIGTGLVSAETFRQGGSTATIEQSGGSGPSESEVTRYPDGQKIITRDGSNTDITIQRGSGVAPPDTDVEDPETYADRFDRRFMEERFSRTDPDVLSGVDCSKCRSSCARDEFKQRMFDRMGGDFLKR